MSKVGRIEEKMNENEDQRRARELIELLQELRVVLPGVQVLFAFMLTVPFSARFGQVSPLQEAVYFGTVACAALSAGFLIAPSAHHRLLWRQEVREHRLVIANRLAIAGMIFFVLAMVGAVFVITSFLYSSTAAAFGAASFAGFFAAVWFVLPLRYRLKGE